MRLFTPKKVCFTCQQRKILTAFMKKAASKDGHDASCRVCINARRKRGRDAKMLGKKMARRLDHDFLQHRRIAPQLPKNTVTVASSSLTTPKNSESAQDDSVRLLEKLQARYQCYMAISVPRKGFGKLILQTHGEEKRIFKADDLLSLFQKAL